MGYKIKLMNLPAQPTLTIRETNPVEKLPGFFGKAFGGVMGYLQEIGETPGGMPFGKYYNVDMHALDVEAGFPVTRPIPGKGSVAAGEIPAGSYISTVHAGPYDTVEPAYQALTDWAEKNGYTPTGIAFEYYLNDPSEGEGITPDYELDLEDEEILQWAIDYLHGDNT